MNKNSLADHSSIYQYTLLKKVRIRPWMWVFYILLLTGCLMFLLSSESLGLCLLILAVVWTLQLFFKRTTLHWMYPVLVKRWSLSLRLPFVGLVPQQPVLYGSFRNVELHTALLGFFLVGSVGIWLPVDAFAAIACTFLTIQLPPLIALLFRMKTVRASNVWIKLQTSDISYYRA